MFRFHDYNVAKYTNACEADSCMLGKGGAVGERRFGQASTGGSLGENFAGQLRGYGATQIVLLMNFSVRQTSDGQSCTLTGEHAGQTEREALLLFWHRLQKMS